MPDAYTLNENAAPGAGHPDAYTKGVEIAGTSSSNSGMVLLASGTITNEALLDLELPSGYSSFKCQLVRMDFSTDSGNNGLGAAFSADGGDTFFNQNDSYTIIIEPAGNDETHALMPFGLFSDWGSLGALVDMIIVPGSATHNAYIQCNQTYRYASDGSVANDVLSIWLTEAPGVVNLIRFIPYANGTIDPPSSGILFANLTYFLWGLPTP